MKNISLIALLLFIILLATFCNDEKKNKSKLIKHESNNSSTINKTRITTNTKITAKKTDNNETYYRTSSDELYQKPNTHFNNRINIPQHSIVQLIKKTKIMNNMNGKLYPFYKVKTPDGTEGYVSTFHLNIIDTNMIKNIKENEPFTGYISADNVRVRKKPSIKSKIISICKIGTSGNVFEKYLIKEKIGKYENYWYHVQFPYDEHGWVFGAFFKKGKFDYKKYLEKIPVFEDIPELYEEIMNNKWEDFTFTNKIIDFSIGDYSPVFQIIDITDMGENQLIIKTKLLLHWTPLQGDSIKKYSIFNIEVLNDGNSLKIKNKSEFDEILVERME